MMPRKLSVTDLDLRGARVFVRVDFNVPLKDGEVADDARLRASLPTLRLILERGGKPILASHLGRPKGRVVPGMSLRPVAARVGALLGRPLRLADDCIGPSVVEHARGLREGELLLLENLRFPLGGEKDDETPVLQEQQLALAQATRMVPHGG